MRERKKYLEIKMNIATKTEIVSQRRRQRMDKDWGGGGSSQILTSVIERIRSESSMSNQTVSWYECMTLIISVKYIV